MSVTYTHTVLSLERIVSALGKEAAETGNPPDLKLWLKALEKAG